MAVATHWQQPGGRADGDFNGDGFVDDLDLTVLALEWPGGGLDVSAVPEPATLSLLALSGLALLHRSPSLQNADIADGVRDFFLARR